MAAEGSAGTADAELAFQFPLKKDLDFDDVSLQVAAQVEDGALRNVFLGQDMTAAQLDVAVDDGSLQLSGPRSEEHTSELPSLMRISYAVFCLKTKEHIENRIAHLRPTTPTPAI